MSVRQAGANVRWMRMGREVTGEEVDLGVAEMEIASKSLDKNNPE